MNQPSEKVDKKQKTSGGIWNQLNAAVNTTNFPREIFADDLLKKYEKVVVVVVDLAPKLKKATFLEENTTKENPTHFSGFSRCL